MKCLHLTAAFLAATLATALPSSIMSRQTAPGRVLISKYGHIYLADYSSSSFEITMDAKDENSSPSWLAYDSATSLLYSVDENSASVKLWNLDVANNKLEQKTVKEGSPGVVHLEFNQDRTRMLGAGYGSGAVDVWDISNNDLNLLKTIKLDSPLGPKKPFQDARHPHQSVLDPSGRFFAVPDLGTDRILILDSEDDTYDIVNRVRVEPAGAGPRHGAFYPKDATKATHFIVLCELKNIINVYELEYTDSSIEFTKIQEISSFADDFTPAEGAAAGELAIIGQHVYISNRITGAETDDITHFRITSSGGEKIQLQFSESVSTGGTKPRMFSVASSGQELLVGNQAGEFGLVSIGITGDGALEDNLRASVKMSEFGEGADAGPAFVQQIA